MHVDLNKWVLRGYFLIVVYRLGIFQFSPFSRFQKHATAEKWGQIVSPRLPFALRVFMGSGRFPPSTKKDVTISRRTPISGGVSSLLYYFTKKVKTWEENVGGWKNGWKTWEENWGENRKNGKNTKSGCRRHTQSKKIAWARGGVKWTSFLTGWKTLFGS